MEVLAVGGALWDILVELKIPFKGDDCYPSIMRTIPGGTTRNFSEAMARLGVEITLISSLALDGLEQTVPLPGKTVFVDRNRSARFIAVLNHKKKRLFSFNDTTPLDELTIEEIIPLLPLKAPPFVFLDTNIPLEVMSFLLSWCKEFRSTTMVDPIAPSKVNKITTMLPLIDILSLSEREYEVLDSKPDSWESILLVKKGADGIDLITPKDKLNFPSLHRGPVISDNGAGDSFNAGYLFGHLRGYTLEERILLGLKAASLTLSSHLNVNPLIQNILK